MAVIAARVRLLRPRQWTKNAFCLAGAVFSGRFAEPRWALQAGLVFLVFCSLSSAVYVLNDLVDRRRDRLHPRKRLRPLASGAVGTFEAVVLMLALAAVAVTGGAALPREVLVVAAIYAATSTAYTAVLKHVPVVDVVTIALLFVLRMLAGVYAVEETPTTWITLCTFFLALFLAVAKRRSEMAANPADGGTAHRPVLRAYSVAYLDQMLAGAALMAVLCYALFTTSSDKNPTLVVTVPIVVYALMHYARRVMTDGSGSEPEMFFRDVPLVIAIGVWLVLYVWITRSGLHLFRAP